MTERKLLKELKVMVEGKIDEYKLQRSVHPFPSYGFGYCNGETLACQDILHFIEKNEEKTPDEQLTAVEAFLKTLEIRDNIRNGWKPVPNENVWFIQFYFGRWLLGSGLNVRSFYTFRTQVGAALFKDRAGKLLSKVEEIL